MHETGKTDMKKWMYTLLAGMLLLFCLPPLAAKADAGGKLSADSSRKNITVTLQKPSEEPQTITALRFWMYITLEEGSMQQPVFRFAEEFTGSTESGHVSSAVIRKQGNGYAADIVVAVKKDRDIFQNNGQAVIGTLSLKQQGAFRAQIGLAAAGGEASGQPLLRYTGSTGQTVQEIGIAGADPLICAVSNDGTPIDPSDDGTIPNLPVTPSQPGTPSRPGQPLPPGNSGSGTVDSDNNPPEEEPGSTGDTQGTGTAGTFDKKAALKLTLSVKKNSATVVFQWKKAAGADGYQIYQYDPDTGKNKRIKTILNADKIKYSKQMEPGAVYSFRLRAFQAGKNGKRTYGRFSPIASVTAAPQKVTGAAVKQLKTSKLSLTWKLKGGADGFQIYRSTKKNGTYTRVKTVSKGTARKYSGLTQTRGRKYYYKVRAYVTGADGKRVYGAFSSKKAAVIR